MPWLTLMASPSIVAEIPETVAGFAAAGFAVSGFPVFR